MQIAEFIKSYPLLEFTKGQVLLGADEETDKILMVRDGIVKVTSINDSGNESLLWLAGRYDIVPTEGILRHSVAPRFFYTAFSDGSAYIVNKKEFIEYSQSNIEVMKQVAQGLSEHHDDLLARLDGLEQPNLRLKIMHILSFLCMKFSSSPVVKLHEIGLNLTHQDIADMVQATREATSIELKRLNDDKLIRYSRSSFTVYANKIADEIKASA